MITNQLMFHNTIIALYSIKSKTTDIMIYFKLLGQALVNSFKAEETLGDVVAFVRDSAKLETFGLMTSFPRKQYQPSDYGFSLKSLGLCPSSVIIVSKQ